MAKYTRGPRRSTGGKRPAFRLYTRVTNIDALMPRPCAEWPEAMVEGPDGTLQPYAQGPSSSTSSAIDNRTRAALNGSVLDGLYNAFNAQDPLSQLTQVAEAKNDTTNAPSQPPVKDMSDYEEQAWYEYNVAPSNHKYTHLSDPICKAGAEGCDLSDVVDALNKKGAHPDQTQPFVPGQDYFADVDIPGPWGPDPIETTAITDPATGIQIGIKNITLEGHVLHPGVIKRTVVLVNNWYHILTDGYGSGPLGGPNVWLRDWVWSDINQDVIEQLQ